jgi:hypothetical protein
VAQDKETSALARLIDGLMLKGKKAIFLSDHDHLSPDIRAAVADEGMMRVFKKHGAKLGLEDASTPASVHTIIETLAWVHTSSDEEVAAKTRAMPEEIAVYHRNDPARRTAHLNATTTLFTHAGTHGVDMVFPDPRPGAHIGHGLDSEEVLLFSTRKTAHEYGQASHAYFLAQQQYGSSANCLASGQAEAVKKALTPEQQSTLDQPQETETQALTGQNDVNTRFARNLDGQSGTKPFVMLVGAAHLSQKTRGIDEYITNPDQSVTIAVLDEPGSKIMADEHEANPVSFEFPDYVYYAKENRVVPLKNNEAARQEYLFGGAGRTEFSMSPKQQEECAAATARIQPYLSSNTSSATHDSTTPPPPPPSQNSKEPNNPTPGTQR